MKIAIPTDDRTENTAVCVSFGRAPYFLLYDMDNGQIEYLPNPAADAEGGAGLKAAQFVVDSGANALFTVRCGQNAAEVLKAADIAIYKTVSTSANECLTDYAEGKLEQMTQFHAGFHGRA